MLCSSRDDIHKQGVALILNKSAQKALLGYNPVSPRLISARFQTQIGTATIIQIYAPNITDPDTLVDDFYDDIQQAVNITPSSDFLILMGDFKVGTNTQNWEGGESATSEEKNCSTFAQQMAFSLQILVLNKAKHQEIGHGNPQMKSTTMRLITSLLIGK